MKDSWSHSDDRRDRGRVDRGVDSGHRSRSPVARRPNSGRASNPRDRSPSRAIAPSSHRHHEQGRERRRPRSRSPARDTGDEFRERNRGRELLDVRGSGKSRYRRDSPQSAKRRKSRSPSVTRSHHKRSRRDRSRSPSHLPTSVHKSSRAGSPPRERSPVRRRSPERRNLDSRGEDRHRTRRSPDLGSRRRRSVSVRRDRVDPSGRAIVPRHTSRPAKRLGTSPREVEEYPAKNRGRRTKSPHYGDRRSGHERRPGGEAESRSERFDRYEPSSRSRQQSPRTFRTVGDSRPSSPGLRESRSIRDEYRRRASRPSLSSHSPVRAKSRDPDMDARGNYGGHTPSYNSNPQMQAAFPLKQHYSQNQHAQMNSRHYSASPQHMTPISHQGSPQAHSPYGGRGGWNGQPQSFSPQQ